MKKILCINYSLSYGGAEKIFAFVANALSENYEVHLMLLCNKPIILNINQNVIIHQYDYLMNIKYHKASFKSIFSEINSVKKDMETLNKRYHFDGVVVFDEKISFISFLAYNKKVKLFYSLRNDPKDKSRIVLMILRFVYNHATAVVFQLPQVCDMLNLRNKKVYIIPNPSIERFVNTQCNKTILNFPYLLSGGRLSYRKGFDILLNAFKIVSDIETDLKLILCGDGEERENLIKQTEKLGLIDKVVFTGYVNDIMFSYNHAECFVLPSRSEGIPNILIEAMKAGIPCVACNCSPGGAAFLTDNGKCGCLVETDNSEKLAEGILTVLRDKNLCENYRSHAYDFLSTLEPERIKKQWIRVFFENL